MVLRTSERQYREPELRESGLVLLQKKQVMERPLWELIGPLLAPQKLGAAAKEWNKGGKHGPYAEHFFFLMQKEPYVTSGNFVSTPFEVHEFMRVVEQGSGRLWDYEFAHDSELAWTPGKKLWLGR